MSTKVYSRSTPPALRNSTKRFKSQQRFQVNTKCICRVKDGWNFQHPLCPVHPLSVVHMEAKSASAKVEEDRYEKNRWR